MFVAVAAIDFGGVVIGAALEQVGVVARIPDHAIVAGLAEHLIVAVATGQRVVAVAAEQKVGAALADQRIVVVLAKQLVGAGATGQDIVADAPEQIGLRQGAVALVETDGVVATKSKCLNETGIGDGGGPPANGDSSAIDQNFAGGVTAGRDRVVQVVAKQVRVPVAKLAVTAMTIISQQNRSRINCAGPCLNQRRASRIIRSKDGW